MEVRDSLCSPPSELQAPHYLLRVLHEWFCGFYLFISCPSSPQTLPHPVPKPRKAVMSLRLLAAFGTGALGELTWLWEHLGRRILWALTSLDPRCLERARWLVGEFLLGDKSEQN